MVDILISLLRTATSKQMLVPYTETVRHCPVFNKHVLKDIEVGRHKLRFAIACTICQLTSTNLLGHRRHTSVFDAIPHNIIHGLLYPRLILSELSDHEDSFQH